MAPLQRFFAFVLLVLLAFVCRCRAYVDFGELTKVRAIPVTVVPRLPSDLPELSVAAVTRVRDPLITALAPVIAMNDNGTHHISWSTAYHQYQRRFQNIKGIFTRPNGLLKRDVSLLATCTPCSTSLSGSQATEHTDAATICRATDYSGVLQSITTPALSALPCCVTCTTPSTSPPLGMPTITEQGSNATITSTGTNTTPGGASTTLAIQTPTGPPVTISITTITPSPTTTETPSVTVAPAIISGCGTASGSGTVIGSGTVFIGPGGIFPVTSSGEVSGFASKVIGCGKIIATVGSFQGSASVTGCGTGTGCAIMTGIGTVFPDALGGFIGITSSGVASGCGKVVGCGTLIGTGTFFITGLVTSTITPSPPRSTVNVYISYCPPEQEATLLPLPFRIDNNATAATIDSSQQQQQQQQQGGRLPHQPNRYLNNNNNGTLPPYADAPPPPFPIPAAINATIGNSNLTNGTGTDLTNPLCQLCHSDSGTCCPLSAACGADGHCPHTALVGSGYVMFGVNVVASANSSVNLGMQPVPGRKPPGAPGPDPISDTDSGSKSGPDTGAGDSNGQSVDGNGLLIRRRLEAERRRYIGGILPAEDGKSRVADVVAVQRRHGRAHDHYHDHNHHRRHHRDAEP